MKKTIAALIAGIMLGVSGTAVAASQIYWHQDGSGYSCEGVTSGVICAAGGYRVGVTPTYVFIQKKGTKQTYACRKWSSFNVCTSG